jgi:hypothetical protein
MDLGLIIRVIWRFKLVVAAGLVIAIALAFFSFMKPTTKGGFHLEYRQQEQWESLSTLFVTSRGFPWGSIGTAAPTDDANASPGESNPNDLDPVHLNGLAALYVRLAVSDPVMAELKKSGPIDGTLAAFPVASDDTGRGTVLPMVTLAAHAPTPEAAVALAKRHDQAFVRYLEREQGKAGIPDDERVVVQVVRQPQEPTLLLGRKKTRPIVVFVGVMMAVIGLAFALENLRPQVRMLPGSEYQFQPPLADTSRRSA